MLALSDLERAVEAGNGEEAMRAARAAIEALKDMAREAQEADLPPDRRALVEDAVRRYRLRLHAVEMEEVYMRFTGHRLGDVLKRLLEATKRRLENPNDPAAKAAFDAALEDARRLATLLHDAVHPQSGRVMFASPDTGMADAIEKLRRALNDLQDAVKRGNQQDVRSLLFSSLSLSFFYSYY
jgi:Asp-tRNA(Asn)/Glu-tRNA(Gln) amidotransferase A subunit family amidase